MAFLAPSREFVPEALDTLLKCSQVSLMLFWTFHKISSAVGIQGKINVEPEILHVASSSGAAADNPLESREVITKCDYTGKCIPLNSKLPASRDCGIPS
jgi:hypothetical protein